jgi:hypothetical protein
MGVSLFCRQLAVRLLVLTLACDLLSVASAAAQSNFPDTVQSSAEFFSSARRVHRRHTRELLTDRNVVGTAVGLTRAGQPAIKVFTKSEAITNVPLDLEGIPVEIEVTGQFHALPAAKTPSSAFPARSSVNPSGLFPRPVPIGVSTGNQNDCSAGTIGARVMDSQGNVYALSNNHVYALENKAALNSAIMQPGLADARCRFDSSNIIATLASFVPIVFSTSASNTVDAAIAASDVSLLGNATPARGGYGTPQSATVAASVGQTVQKYGETTRLTQGRISGIDATILVDYDSGTARFVNQILVTSSKNFIRAGDSGSLLVTRSGTNPVGLIFAGDTRGRMAIANPIDLVLGALGVFIDGR